MIKGTRQAPDFHCPRYKEIKAKENISVNVSLRLRKRIGISNEISMIPVIRHHECTDVIPAVK